MRTFAPSVSAFPSLRAITEHVVRLETGETKFFSAENFALWVGFFSLKSLHPYNGCLPVDCGQGGYPDLLGLELNAKIRLLGFVFTDFFVFD